jgi:hypothetical protein
MQKHGVEELQRLQILVLKELGEELLEATAEEVNDEEQNDHNKVLSTPSP